MGGERLAHGEEQVRVALGRFAQPAQRALDRRRVPPRRTPRGALDLAPLGLWIEPVQLVAT